MKVLQISALLSVLLISVCIFSGCAGTMQAIEHREMSMSAKMSDTIFLDPETLMKHRNIFVRVTNTSDFQEIDFLEVLKGKLAAKGYSVTNDPSKAGYIVQANLLYMGEEKKGLTADAMLAGGFGGGLAGAAMGGDWKGSAVGGLAGAAVGSVVGGLVGSMIHVDTYLGTLDVQVKELVEGGVTGTMQTDAKQGSATRLTTHRDVKSTHQEYRTRIVVQAKQTNINRQEACNRIIDRLATQIGGMF